MITCRSLVLSLSGASKCRLASASLEPPDMITCRSLVLGLSGASLLPPSWPDIIFVTLADFIVERPLPPMWAYDSPLPLGALVRLADPPSESNPLEPYLVPEAQCIAGTIGTIVEPRHMRYIAPAGLAADIEPRHLLCIAPAELPANIIFATIVEPRATRSALRPRSCRPISSSRRSSSRWLGTRYAMIRHGEAANIIRLRKIGAGENCANIFTKCLTSEAFRRNRARVLGLPYTPVESPAEEAPELTPEPLPRIRPREGDREHMGDPGTGREVTVWTACERAHRMRTKTRWRILRIPAEVPGDAEPQGVSPCDDDIPLGAAMHPEGHWVSTADTFPWAPRCAPKKYSHHQIWNIGWRP